MGIKLVVKSRDVEYSIELFRKYTVVQGESGTGKTTLVQRIEQFNRGISKFGAVSIQCELEVNAAGMAFRDVEDFEEFLKKNEGVVVLDEFVMSSIRFNAADVAKLLKKYDRYYVLISREGELFKSVPVAIDDLVEVKGSGKYHTFRKVYELNPVV